jgi:hypothetical protein
MPTLTAPTDVAVQAPRAERVCRLLEWRPWPFPNPSLLGHCSVSFSGGWCVHRVPVFKRADGTISVSTPEAADVDREGRAKLKPDGKRSYTKIITFETASARERWQQSILAALAAAGISGEVQP